LATKEDFLNGKVLLFNKGKDWTSFDLVNKARYIIRNKFDIKKIKVGHAGTLDPLATGLVIVCTGKETKKINQYQDADKTYLTTITFGATTPSFDLETEPDKTYPYQHITKEKLEKAIASLTGEIEQIPPAYSAIHVNGQRAYQAARKGENPKLKARKVQVYKMKILDFNLPDIKLEINCGKGTYIRAIARDLGKELQSGAHLKQLERTTIGSYNITNAISIKEFENQLINDKIN